MMRRAVGYVLWLPLVLVAAGASGSHAAVEEDAWEIELYGGGRARHGYTVAIGWTFGG